MYAHIAHKHTHTHTFIHTKCTFNTHTQPSALSEPSSPGHLTQYCIRRIRPDLHRFLNCSVSNCLHCFKDNILSGIQHQASILSPPPFLPVQDTTTVHMIVVPIRPYQDGRQIQQTLEVRSIWEGWETALPKPGSRSRERMRRGI